ncbi:Type 1 glutamine amidotransferase-like domain-containing protein [Candidatus Campbellbacteria bacterium]|nr:MAG: Type 1 glutamine amidotransferase-like domain-containing protein [Candidatus Campbellbacteria bacterium]
MKLLLTSGGFTNKTIIDTLRKLVGKDFIDATLAFIPTAANVEEGDKEWLISDLAKCTELGFKEVDIVDIAAVSKEVWLPRLQHADVLLFGGGNTSYLMAQIKKSGLIEALPELLKSRVYVGISAGSMVTSPNLLEKEMQRLYNEPILDGASNEGLGFVDFLVVPHMNSPYFPRASELIDEVAQGVDVPLYALDDQSAVQVVGDNVEVVTQGIWKRFN